MMVKMVEGVLINQVDTKPTMTLEEMRESRNLTRMNVQRRLDIAYNSLKNWELGKTAPNIRYIHKLLTLYNYKIEDLNYTQYIND